MSGRCVIATRRRGLIWQLQRNRNSEGGLSMDTESREVSYYDLPIEAKEQLLLAAEHWEDDERSASYIEGVLRQYADDLDVLVSAYRFFFYKSRPERALPIVDQILAQLQATESLPLEWEDLQPILTSGRDDARLRLYIAAYAGRGLLLAQLGRLEEARLVSGRVKAIDDRGEFCGRTVFDVLTALPEDD